MGRKLAIVCGAPSSEMDAPFNDLSYDVWVLGNRSDRYPRFTAVFEIHDNLTEHSEKYPHYLVELKKRLIVGEKFPFTGPHIEQYPYATVNRLIGFDYLTSSSAYMLALAIIEGYKHVELYGVDMATDDHEYFWQRPCMEFWCGFAKGRGVNLFIPTISPLCKSAYVEGRDHGTNKPPTPKPICEYQTMADKHKVRRGEAIEKLNELRELEQTITNLKQQVAAHDGAAQVYEQLARLERGGGSLKNSVVIK